MTRLVASGAVNRLSFTRGAFLDSGGGRIAFVVHGDIANRVAIKTGSTSISAVEIVAGLQPGDQIIVSNLGEFERSEAIRLNN